MDLSTTWCGFTLPHPLVPGASPLCDDLDTVRRLEDAGAAAFVLRSLFEEELVGEQLAAFRHLEPHANAMPESLSFWPDTDAFGRAGDDYLEHVRRVKASVGVPVVASLNGATPGGWVAWAQRLVEAGADALELNVYYVAADLAESGAAVERRVLDLAAAVKAQVTRPVAVKLSPYFSALGHLARELDALGVDGLVLFNRFYEPDVDPEHLAVERRLRLSTSDDLLLRLHWLAILSGRVRAALAVSGGVHTTHDAVKAVMCGADAVQLVSALLLQGPDRLATIRDGLAAWLEEHEYDSLAQMRGSMSLQRCPDPQHYLRLNYMELLRSWRP